MLPLTLALFSFAQTPSPQFAIHTTDPKPLFGAVTKLDADGLTLREPNVTIPAGNLIAIKRTGLPLPPFPRDEHAVLANGDRIRGTVQGGDSKAILFHPAWQAQAEVWNLPLGVLAALWLRPPPADMPFDPIAYPWADAPKRRDAAWLRNGDVVRGTIEGFANDPPGLRLRSNEVTTLRLDQLAAVAFDPSLARVRKPKGPYYRVTLNDGSRITLGTASIKDGKLSGLALAGPSLSVPIGSVLVLDVVQGKAIDLSDLKPKRSEVQPYQGVTWPWAADRSIRGNPLQLGSETYVKGLGTHSKTTLVYDLAGKYRRFESKVGLDPASGRRGSVDVRILVDGKEVPLPDLIGLTFGKGPQRVVVDLKGANELTLLVDYGPAGDVQDDVNWAEPRLILE